MAGTAPDSKASAAEGSHVRPVRIGHRNSQKVLMEEVSIHALVPFCEPGLQACRYSRRRRYVAQDIICGVTASEMARLLLLAGSG